MRINAMNEKFEDVTVFGIPMIFTCLRVDRGTVPKGLYMYEVRHDDESRGDPIEIAEWIIVNHWGTVISDTPLELISDAGRANSHLFIDPEQDWNYEGTSTTVKEYMNRRRSE